jgi:hypothetical protein
MEKDRQEGTAQKYYIKIEGAEYPWDQSSITVGDMRKLANLSVGLSVVEEFPDGSERTLADSDTITLKPGHRYGRAPKFKRG